MAVLHDLPLPRLVLDEQGVIVKCNARLAHEVGISIEALTGRSFDSLLSPSSRVLYQSYLQPLLRLHGHVQELALTLRKRDGADLEVLVYSSRRGDENAAAVQLLLAPIRRRRTIEEQALRIKQAADHAPGLIFQLRRSGGDPWRFGFVSEAVRRLYGITPEQACSSADALFDQIEPQHRMRLFETLDAVARQDGDWQGDFEVLRPGQAPQVHEMHVTGRRLADGTTLWHGHIADVTPRRELERTYAEQQTAVRVQQERSAILARISHELRTPLNGILGFIELVLSDDGGNFSQEQRQRLAIAQSSGRHLLYLVNQVLDLSQSEMQRCEVDLKAVSVRAAIEAAIAVVQPLARAAGITLRTLVDDRRLLAQAHEPFVHQVLINLLSNAVKYNHRDGWVEVHAERRQGRVVIDISDTGPGLTPPQKAELFQPFNRLGAQFSDKPGTGLGLTISKQLVTLMRGDILVETEPGKGSTFSVALECAESDVAQACVETGTAQPVSQAESDMRAPEPQAPAAGRVLYVEDNPVNAILMEAIVARRPMVQMRLAVDGASALALVQTWKPDLLLVDLHLPDMSGTALLRALRADADLGDVPAIVVSASAESDEVARARAAGFVDFWTKPLDLQATLRGLDRRLSRDTSVPDGARPAS